MRVCRTAELYWNHSCRFAMGKKILKKVLTHFCAFG